MEAPENIGSALKSIISRYGEMTSDPTKLVDSEGEEMNLNKVDKALKSVGITLQDANGQFRNFDEVILELSSKWDTIDTNTQRYIATVMAGNRQQSRFLAMVGNYERLSELSEEAADSEDAALIQQLKTMDSIETKLNQLKVTFQEFYTSSGIEDLIKGILDFVTRIINTMNSMPKLFGKIPVAAIGVVAQIISSLKNLSTKLLGVIDNLAETLAKKIKEAIHDGVDSGLDAAEDEIEQSKERRFSNNKKQKTEADKKREAWINSKGAKALGIGGTIASAVGTALTSAGVMTATGSNRKSGWMQAGGVVLSIGGSIASGAATGGLPGAIIGGVIGLVGQIPTIISAIDEFTETTEERVARLQENARTTKEDALIAKNEYKTIEQYRKKLEDLNETKHESAESYQEWIDLNNELVEKYPELLDYIDTEGNKIAVLSEEWGTAAKAKEQYYKKEREAIVAELNYMTDEGVRFIEGLGGQNPFKDTLGNDPTYDIFKKTVERLALTENAYKIGTELFLEIMDEYAGDDIFNLAGTSFAVRDKRREQYYHDFFDESINPESLTTVEYYDKGRKEKVADSDRVTHGDLYSAMTSAIKMIGIGATFDEVNNYLREQTKAGQLAQRTGYSFLIPEISEEMYISFRNLGEVHSEEEEQRNQKQIISAISQYVASEDDLNEAFEITSQFQMDAMSSALYKKFKEWRESGITPDADIKTALGLDSRIKLGEGDYLKYYFENYDKIGRLIPSEINSSSLSGEVEKLTEESQKELDSIYLQATNYSLEQWLSALGQILGQDIIDVNKDELTAQYNEKTGTLYQNQKDALALFLGKADNLSNLEITNLNSFIDQFSSSSLGSFINLKNKGISAELLADLMKSFSNLDTETAQLFGSLVSKYDISSLSGLISIRSEMNSSELKESFQLIRDFLNINLETEWINFSEQIISSLELLEESLSKASSGMNLEEAKKMAEKLEISITEFELVDGQFFFRDLDAIQEYYLKQHKTLQSELEKETESQIKETTKVFGTIFKSEAIDFSTLSEEMLAHYNRYAGEWANSGSELSLGAYIEEQLNLLLEENLTVSNNYRDQQIQQITKEYTKQIFEIVSNAITGSMSNGELTTLTAFLENQKANLNLKYFETADGLQLTQDSILQIYEELSKVDSLAAQVVLDELTESAMEAEEKFSNIYEVLEHITKLNREIEEAKDTAREDALRRELVLAESIRDTLMEAGNAFNFMNQDLPTGHTNPLSAWEGMGDAWKIIEGDDFKAGYIDYTDLYNMINMMSSAGVALQTEAGEFKFNADTASELMQAAGQALVNVDGETFVDLSKLGTQFQFGAEGMQEGLMKGIKIIAKSQIELLDAEIAMLETVVKTEEAFSSIDLDENKGILSNDELINGLFGDNENFKSGILDKESEIYDWLMERKDWAIQIGEDTWTIFALLEGLQDSGRKDRGTLLEYLASFINEEYSRIEGIDWSVKGEKLFKNGLEVELPPIVFSSSENFPFDSILNTWTGEDDLSDFNKKFKEYLEVNNKVTFTPADLIEFTNEAEYSDAFINWLITQKDEMINQARRITTQDGQVILVRWDVEYETWVSDSGDLYDEQGYKLSKEEILQKKLDEIAEQQGISELTLESLKIQLKDNGWTIEGKTETFSLTDILKIVQKQIELEQKNNQHTFLEITPDVGVTPKVDTVPIEVRPSEVTLDYSLLKDGKLKISTRGQEGGKDLSVAVDSISVSGNEVFYSLDGEEGEMTAEQVVAKLGLDISTEEGQQALIDLQNSTETLKDSVEPLKTSSQIAEEKIDGLDGSLNSVATQAEIAAQKLDNVASSLDGVTTGYSHPNRRGGLAHARGNVGNAKATGTLMGELGPELYVTGGRYYVAGQNGAEFVNLPSDAIVFNHLQTKRLLESGSINGTGKPVTNERNATAMATGTTGPAKASASDALKELYEIRAMWQGLLNADASDFAKKAGSGGGGGGGEDDKAFMHDLERWYNLLRQIAKLEQQITYEQAKRENMRSGYNHVQSLEKELALLKKQQKAHQLLSDLQKDYYDKRRKELLSTDYSKIFTYDDEGLMQYVDGKNRGLDILATLNETDEHGKALMTAKQQVQYLKDLGFDISKFQINADGSKVKSNDYQTMMQIFWDGVDGWMAELDELYDSYNESMTSVEESIQAQNEILQEYIDNQLSVEERLMEAIVSREEAEIERLEKELDALEDATDAYLDGLKDSLDREKEMYEKNKDSEETSKLQRQLAILKRTGGSASEIQSLQDEISSRLEDSYFQQQEDQIDAIQQAADNQIEKLQTQIDIMNETLEYQKANGLLWEEVYEMMNNWSPEQMLQFIEEFLPSYREDSALQSDENSKEALKEFEIWVAKRENAEALADAWQNYYDSISQYSDEFKAEHAEGAKNAYSLAYATKGEEEAKKAADAYYAEMMKKETDSIPEDDKEPEDDNKEPSTTTGSTKPSSGDNAGSTNDKEFVKKVQRKLNNFGNYGLTVDGIAGTKTKAAIKDFQRKNNLSVDGLVGSKTWEKLKVYKAGGLVDFTGPAWVDGTKTKPEAFLSAEDTAMLKSKIFDNNKFSLRSVVELFEGISDSNRSITTNNDQGVVFENVQITIESGTISNDYDARRVGEMALEEMLKISRKTANRIISRR